MIFGGILTVTERHLGEEVPHMLEAVTQTSPLVEPNVTVIASVPAPAVIEAPDGSVQL